jgi:hypothetical protein
MEDLNKKCKGKQSLFQSVHMWLGRDRSASEADYITCIHTFRRSISCSRQREYETGQGDNVGCDAQLRYDRTHTVVIKYTIQNKIGYFWYCVICYLFVFWFKGTVFVFECGCRQLYLQNIHDSQHFLKYITQNVN